MKYFLYIKLNSKCSSKTTLASIQEIVYLLFCRHYQSDKKRSTSEEAALTVNSSYGVHTQLKRNNNDNSTNEESHHREPVQLELQEDNVETRHLLSEVENLEYYTTISEY